MFLYNVIFHFYVGGEGVSDSHVQAQILPVGAHKGDEQVSRTLFFDKCQTTGVGGQMIFAHMGPNFIFGFFHKYCEVSNIPV